MKYFLEEKFTNLAGNPVTYKYLAEPEVRIPQPDGTTLVTRPRCTSITTPNGDPVTSEYIQDTLSFKGNWSDLVNGRRYTGPVVVTMGPETDTTIEPKWQPYDPSNGNPGGH